MPRLHDSNLLCVFYLYPSVEAAGSGERQGGTGFVVAFRSSEHEGMIYGYGITNAHVVRDYGSPVIRFNRKDGSTDVWPLKSEDWITHPDGDDIAVTWLQADLFKQYDLAYIHAQEMCALKSVIADYDVGVGDDVMTVGRFISHDGGLVNKPSIRFGNISMMPTTISFRGVDQECYLVETRSLRGSSGSPVFLTMYDAQRRHLNLHPDEAVHPPQNTWLLGIACADVPYEEEVNKRTIDEDGYESIEDTNYFALSNSGQMAVIPAWKIYDFLDKDERFVMPRKEGDKAMHDKKKNSPLRPTAEKTPPPVLTKDGFEAALKQASQKVEPESEKK